jgi:CheY-like chemotaxis protein
MEIAFTSCLPRNPHLDIIRKTTELPMEKLKRQVKSQMDIIIVDDDEDDKELLADAISELSSNVHIRLAASGKELMKQLGERKLPDLVFLDLNMPLMNGFECLARIKKEPKYKDLLVLIYSTSANPDQIELTFQEGAYLYIQKPSSIIELKNIVKKVMELTKNRATSRPTRNEFLLRS